MLLPENFAFILANSIQQATQQAVQANLNQQQKQGNGEVTTNINNNINFYGPVQLQSSADVELGTKSTTFYPQNNT